MPRYMRAFVPGGTFFFTVAWLERRRRLLTEHIDDLRAVFGAARERHPFTIDAIVVLPEHLHCLWTLPPGMPISPVAGMRSRPASRHGFRRRNAYPVGVSVRVSVASGSGAFGSMPSAMRAISSDISTTSITIR
jgi:REP element-mobilizing transposase RayT